MGMCGQWQVFLSDFLFSKHPILLSFIENLMVFPSSVASQTGEVSLKIAAGAFLTT
jgi:hypothetical protein